MDNQWGSELTKRTNRLGKGCHPTWHCESGWLGLLLLLRTHDNILTGPTIVACQWNKSSPTGPAEQFEGGSRSRSLSSYGRSIHQHVVSMPTTRVPFTLLIRFKAIFSFFKKIYNTEEKEVCRNIALFIELCHSAVIQSLGYKMLTTSQHRSLFPRKKMYLYWFALNSLVSCCHGVNQQEVRFDEFHMCLARELINQEMAKWW